MCLFAPPYIKQTIISELSRNYILQVQNVKYKIEIVSIVCLLLASIMKIAFIVGFPVRTGIYYIDS